MKFPLTVIYLGTHLWTVLDITISTVPCALEVNWLVLLSSAVSLAVTFQFIVISSKEGARSYQPASATRS